MGVRSLPRQRQHPSSASLHSFYPAETAGCRAAKSHGFGVERLSPSRPLPSKTATTDNKKKPKRTFATATTTATATSTATATATATARGLRIEEKKDQTKSKQPKQKLHKQYEHLPSDSCIIT